MLGNNSESVVGQTIRIRVINYRVITILIHPDVILDNFICQNS
jgi:hypothetical protein